MLDDIDISLEKVNHVERKKTKRKKKKKRNILFYVAVFYMSIYNDY